MRKPCRFEQMAEREYEKWLNGDMSQRGWLQVAERCMALQHAAYVRMVKRAGCGGCNPGFGHNEIVADILAAFSHYKKEKP